MLKKKIHVRMAGSGLNLTLYAGAFQALEEAGYEPASVAGSSGGGVVGAVWASGMSAKEIQDLLLTFMPPALKILDAPWFPVTWIIKWGLYRMRALQQKMKDILKEKGVVRFKDTNVPFACFTTNMNTGLACTWSSFHTPEEILGDRVVDGTRLPVAMQPGWINGDPHRDGGLAYNYPIDFQFPDQDQTIPTIGLLFRGTAHLNGKIDSALKDLTACIDIMLASTAREHIEDAPWARTVILEPAGSAMNFFKSAEEAKADFKVGYNCVKDWLAEHESSLSAT